MQRVSEALAGIGNTLPRRAVVLPDGTLGDKAKHPSLVEVVAVSLTCEELRRQQGEPVMSRNTAQLMQQCTGDNLLEAWTALADDVCTGDVDFDTAREALAASDRTIVGCIVSATCCNHVWAVVRAARSLLPLLDAATARRTGAAFRDMFQQVMIVIAQRGRESEEDRAQGITALGKLIVWCDLSVPTLADMLRTCVLSDLHNEVLRLFLFAPIADMCHQSPDIVPLLVHRAEKANQDAKYPPCALLALSPAATLVPHAAALREVCDKLLRTGLGQNGLDAKLSLACAALARAILPPRSLESRLAHSLVCMSAAVRRTQSLTTLL